MPSLRWRVEMGDDDAEQVTRERELFGLTPGAPAPWAPGYA
jgi:hypothetical protein